MAILYFAEDTQDIYARCGGVAFEDMLINVFKNISGRPGVRPPHCALKISSQCVEKRYTPTSTEHTPLQSALFSH